MQTDKRASIALWNFYFRNEKGRRKFSDEKFAYKGRFTEIGTKGSAVRRNDFYSKEMDYFSHIMQPTFDLIEMDDQLKIECKGEKTEGHQKRKCLRWKSDYESRSEL